MAKKTKRPPKVRSASAIGKQSKRRGKAFEKRVADRIAEWLGVSSGITAEDDVQRTRSGMDDCDVGLTEEVKALFPYWTECKDQKVLKLPAWIKQVAVAQKRRNDDREPIIVYKLPRDSTLRVDLRFDHFMHLATQFLNFQEEPERHGVSSQ